MQIEPRMDSARLLPLQRLYNRGLLLAGADKTRIEKPAHKVLSMEITEAASKMIETTEPKQKLCVCFYPCLSVLIRG
jgi:hypothetical protein